MIDERPEDPVATGVRAEHGSATGASDMEVARLRRAVEASGEVIFTTARDGTLTYVNPAFVDLYGYSSSEVVGRATPRILKSGVVPPETYVAFWETLVRKQVARVAIVNRAKDGRLVEIEGSANPILDDAGEIVGFVAVQRSIAERRRSEDAVMRREAILRAVNLAAERFLQIRDWRRTIDEVLARLGEAATVSRVVVFENRPGTAGEILISRTHEWRALGIEERPDELLKDLPLRATGFGRWIDVLGVGHPIAAHVRELPTEEQPVLAAQGIRSIVVVPVLVDQQWWGFIGFDACATERAWDAMETEALQVAARILGEAIRRERAGAALRVSETRYRTLTESAQDAIFIIDPDLRVQYVNPFGNRMLARSPAEIVGQAVSELFPPGIADGYVRNIRRVLATGETLSAENPVTPDGSGMWLSTRLTPLRDDAGHVTSVLGIARDITERKLAGDAVRKSEAELREAQRVAHLGSWEWAIETDKITWSEELCRILGVDPHAPPPGFEGLPPFYAPESWTQLRAAVEDALRSGAPYELDLEMIRADDAHIWTTIRGEVVRDASGRIVGLRGTVLDITERRRGEEALRHSEDRLRQAQKMEAVGQLAGGVAHDFNNLLTAILGNASLLAETSLTPAEVQVRARHLIEAANRGAGLTRQLLTFGRRQVIQVRRVDLNDLLADLLKMLSRLLGEHVGVRCDYMPGLPLIEADTGMVEQVIVNLAVNARDAMPRGGSLTIRTRRADVDLAAVERNPEARIGPFVALEVGDTGCGMEPATLSHIFEPFFTTKDVGKGTGLGLATVHGIVKQHDGWIEVASRAGAGSLFTVYFPAVDGEAKPDGSEGAVGVIAGGDETILVVEDEASVRRLASMCLSRQGYRILEAANGLEAERIWREHGGRIDLLVTDIVMPEGMNGRELAQLLRGSDPNLKVIYSSGYSPDMLDGGPELPAGDGFLAKPYMPAALALAVRRSLDAS